MKKIILKHGDELIVDDCDFDEISRYGWCVLRDYRKPSKPVKSVMAKIRGKMVAIHRLIMKAEKGQMVDHRDRNPLNNIRDNLRICTNRQNIWNSIKPNKLCYTGISKVNGGFVTKMRINGKNECLGFFKEAERAAECYINASKEIHGEFSVFK